MMKVKGYSGSISEYGKKCQWLIRCVEKVEKPIA